MPPDLSPEAASRHASITHLFEAYARPLQVFLMQHGSEPPEAEGRVQSFFETAASLDLMEGAGQREKCFRSFLLGEFMSWLAREQQQEHVRAPGSRSEAAARAYDREWAGAVLGRAMMKVRMHYEQKGRVPLFEALRCILPGSDQPPPYSRMAMDFGMGEALVDQAAHDLRASCSDYLRAEVAQTVTEPEMVDEETRYLLCLLQVQN
jgi:hypothetical protein